MKYRRLGLMCCLSIPPLVAHRAFAIDTVFIPAQAGLGYYGTTLEVQGFSGRLDLPLQIQPVTQSFPFNAAIAAGAAANDSTLYTLVNSNTNSTADSVIVSSDAQTGEYLGQVQLGTRLADIAYTDGQLYGVLPNENELVIDSIASDGTTQNVVNIAEPAFTGNWLLSGFVNGDELLATQASTSSHQGSNAVGYVVAPTDPQQASQITLFGGQNGGSPAHTVFSADGQSVTTISTNGGQGVTSLATDTSIGPRSDNMLYGGGSTVSSISDEFNYTYAASQPAYVTLDLGETTPSPLLSADDGLIRAPEEFSTTISEGIENGVAPDGVTLSDISATNIFSQIGGPSPMTIQEQDAPGGDLSSITLGSATITINLATAQRGQYVISISPNIAATYSYGSTVDTGRIVQYPQYSPLWFGYDPISSNIVGNGDASLGPTGWESRQGDNGNWESQHLAVSSAGFLIPNTFGYSSAMRQFLQEPTAGSPMTLSFTGQLWSDLVPASFEVQVDLNGELVDDVFVNSTSPQTFSTEITDPAMENLNNAVLMFYVPENSTENQIYLDNISLTAVPEPAGCSMAVMLGCVCLGRRRRIRASVR